MLGKKNFCGEYLKKILLQECGEELIEKLNIERLAQQPVVYIASLDEAGLLLLRRLPRHLGRR